MLPPGALAVGGGLLASGVGAYAFLVIASRALGPDRYSPLSALWALIFVAAPGLFLPLEQEVGRALAARRVAGVGWRPVLVRATTLGACLVLALLVVTGAAAKPIIDRLFDGQALLFAGFAAAVTCYAGYFLARGTLAGLGRFRAYGWLLGAESGARLLATLALAVAGVQVAGIYSLAIGIPAAVAVAVVLPRQRDLASPGPPAPWSELGPALGLLLVGSLMAQLLINIAPLAIKVIDTSDTAQAGRFLDAIIVARIPLFFFQAVQASLLPRLSAQAAAGRLDEFRAGLRDILRLVAVVVVVATLGMFVLGPFVVRVVFGSGFVLGRTDFALLAFGSELMMAGFALAYGCIALASYGRAALGWTAGIATVAVGLAVLPGDVLRVELAFCAGVMAACTVLAIGLRGLLARASGRAVAVG
jgi:O-antigen/teichoic acid export membrane protein